MKAPEKFRITAIRLVEFHNLGTTTVEIPDGGHLFLLGDNGSGKTTLLDAVHLVLTAGRDMELNAAARVAGDKHSGGRTYQGIVLRYNAVTGRPFRESGVTYAALELRSDQGRVLSFAVGLDAEGMDIAIERWGGIASVPVAELPLTIEEAGRLRAATQGEFKRAIVKLTGGHCFAHINEYAEAVGTRLFGNAGKYDNVCKLLKTGKAYREIAARAANYDELFRQLLEDPSRETFEPFLKGLRELDESKIKLDDIEDRAKYLLELQRKSEQLSDWRLKTELVSWAEAEHARACGIAAIEQLSAAIDAGRDECAKRKADFVTAHEDTVHARERLNELRAKDASGLINQEKNCEANLATAEHRAVLAEEAAAKAKKSLATEAEAEASVDRRLSEVSSAGAEQLRRLAKSTGLPFGSLADELSGRSFSAEAFAAAREQVASASAECSQRAFEAKRLLEDAEKAVESAKQEHRKLSDSKENLPMLPGFAECRAEICAAMLSAQSVFELLEPANGCDGRHLALLERFLGEDFLATFIADPDQADAVRRLALKEGRAFTVAERDSVYEDVTPWLGRYLSFNESDVYALKLVSLQLVASGAPKDGDFLDCRTWSFRGRQGTFDADRPRLIGRKAREAEHLRLVHEVEARVALAEKEAKSLRRQLDNANEAFTSVQKAEQTLAKIENEIRDAITEWRIAAERLASLRRETERALTTADERRREADKVRDELEDLRLRMRSAGVDGALEKKINALAQKIGELESIENKLQRELGGIGNKIDVLEAERTARKADVERAAETAGRIAAALASRIPDGMALSEFARSSCPESFVADADFTALREDFIVSGRGTELEIAKQIRDDKGKSFSFAFNAVANRLTDGRGTSLKDIIADETRRLEELRDVIDRKNCEVFERIFMGEVIQRLNIDYLRINDLVSRIQRKLSGRAFGSNRYAFAITPVPEYEGFVNLVRKGYLFDSDEGKDELREYMKHHWEEIRNAEYDSIPEIFDYRKWFRFQLKVLVKNDEGRVIDRKVKSMGSGGEQAVPNYLLILTVAEFLYHGSESVDPPKTAPLLFDEAFYGIDAERRDQLLAFAESLGLQLFVSSPDQDGVKREIRNSVSLIVVKDENLDVHLSPILWKNAPVQTNMLDDALSIGSGMTVMEETK